VGNRRRCIVRCAHNTNPAEGYWFHFIQRCLPAATSSVSRKGRPSRTHDQGDQRDENPEERHKLICDPRSGPSLSLRHRWSPVAVVPLASPRSQLGYDQGDQYGDKAAGSHKRQELDYGWHRHAVRLSSRTSLHKNF
jgi:hypothetical protein